MDYKRVVGLGMAVGLFAGCGDDGNGSAGDSASSSSGGTGGGTGSATMQVVTSGGPDGSGSATDSSATQGSMSATESQGTTVSSVTDSSATGTSGVGPTTDTASDTVNTSIASESGTDTGEGCDPEQQCGDLCCAPGDVCSEGQCQKDCGGAPPCGEQQDCCADGELCNQGQCVLPAGPCQQATCATLDNDQCPADHVCDVKLGLCLPSQADPSCQYIPPGGLFEPVPIFTWGTRAKMACAQASECQTAEVCEDGFCKVTWPHLDIAPDDLPLQNQSAATAAVVDLDRDCVPEIVFNTYQAPNLTTNGVLRAIRGDTGKKVWTVTDPAWRTAGGSSPAIGDIDGDGQAEIIVQGAGRFLMAFKHDGTPLWKSELFKTAYTGAAVAIANIDGDGDAEIVIGAAVYDAKGKLLFEGAGGIGLNNTLGPISCIADLDDDGRQEVIAGRSAYTFTGTVAMGNFAGQTLWTAVPGDGYCGLGDFNGDKKPEVILVATGSIYALNGQTGAVLAQAPIPNGGRGGPPNIADFDGDKKPEVAAAGSSQYIVYKYAGGNAFVKLWSAVTKDTSSQVTGSSVFDFDGDGRNEVVYNDEVHIRIYPGVEPDCQKMPKGPACDGNMTDAEVLFIDRNSSRTVTEYPVIADVDGDFKAEIVFPTNNDGASKLDSGIEVWGELRDNWVATRPVWNQHSYHITNVGLVGAIPVTEPPSWTTPMDEPYNSYRRNAQGEGDDAFCAPDLKVTELGVVYESCPNLEMTVTVGNAGCLGVGPGVNVSFYEQTLGYLGTVQTVGPLPAGASEQVGFVYNTDQKPSQIWAVVDEDDKMVGQLNECTEDNNKSPTVLVCVPPPR